ncbi:MAG: hypothetical protein P8J37_13725 [Fuerstiella sp.]|nr:hypothetical protein [Fuerstiella sp.]
MTPTNTGFKIALRKGDGTKPLMQLPAALIRVTQAARNLNAEAANEWQTLPFRMGNASVSHDQE